VIVLQAASVAAFQGVALGSGGPVDQWAMFGAALCALSCVAGGMGSIMQQRFMQAQAAEVSVPIKLMYQHLLQLVLVSATMLRADTRARLAADGFFGGWSAVVCAASAVLWLSFLTSSAVCAYISAMAGTMGAAICVVVTGVAEAAIFGAHFSALQYALMAAVCALAIGFAQLIDLGRRAAIADFRVAFPALADKVAPPLYAPLLADA